MDNLIDLPGSPTKNAPLSEKPQPAKETPTTTVSAKDEIKALESEFIEPKDADKKAEAATLLLNLGKLIKDENNPKADQVLHDLQKLLGVECDSNTEILKVCLQSTEKKKKTHNESDPDRVSDNVQESNGLKNNSSDTDSRQDSSNNATNPSEGETDESQNVHSASENGERVDKSTESPEDHDLAVSLIRNLNKIVKGGSDESACDILRNLTMVLSMATELRSKHKVKEPPRSKESEKIAPKRVNRSMNSPYKSPGSKYLSTQVNH